VNLCDSGSLLDGRATLGPESNAPNTLGSSCADGKKGAYHVDSSVDAIVVVHERPLATYGWRARSTRGESPRERRLRERESRSLHLREPIGDDADLDLRG
jgi:hypothetical protein